MIIEDFLAVLGELLDEYSDDDIYGDTDVEDIYYASGVLYDGFDVSYHPFLEKHYNVEYIKRAAYLLDSSTSDWLSDTKPEEDDLYDFIYNIRHAIDEIGVDNITDLIMKNRKTYKP